MVSKVMSRHTLMVSKVMSHERLKNQENFMCPHALAVFSGPVTYTHVVNHWWDFV